MEKFNHYPEVQNNILMILYTILNKSDPKSVEKFVEIFDIQTLDNYLDIYRCKLRSSAKEINSYHLNILYLITSNLIKSGNPKNTTILITIAHSIGNFFDKQNKRYNDFSKRKFYEIQIQDTILKIVNILSRNGECTKILLETEFFDNLICYIIDFSGKNNSDTKSVSSKKQKDYLQRIVEKKIRLNIDIVKKICFSIMISICNILFNIVNDEGNLFDIFALLVICI